MILFILQCLYISGDVLLTYFFSAERFFLLLSYNSTFVFDIADWKVSSSRYLSKERPAGFDQSRIKLTFQNCRDIKIVDPFRDLGEIKFGNSSDRKLMRQDEFPGLAPELERPFCVFYARSGESIIIDFDEETCIISAELC